MKSPEKLVEEYIKKQYCSYMKKARKAIRKYRNDADYIKRMYSDPNYKKAQQWGELTRHYNIMCMKETELADVLLFLKNNNLYEEYCHWKFADEETVEDDYPW